MKKFLEILISIILLSIIGGLAYEFRAPIEAKVLPVYENLKSRFFPEVPCAQPIPYTLGTFDVEFGISKTYFLSALADAEAVWEKPEAGYVGKNLFVYSPTDTSSDALKINLIYDYRQETTSKLSNLGVAVNDDQNSYDQLKAKFTALKQEYETELNSYNTAVQAFNKSDRTNQTEFQRLQAQQKDLSSKTDQINSLVEVLNKLVASLNLSVGKYNTVNGTLGESFEEGVYVQDGVNRHIDIYEYTNRNKLVRVLAHELGHALGLQHVDDSKAIMYKLNQGTSLTPTQADLDELKTVCKIK